MRKAGSARGALWEDRPARRVAWRAWRERKSSGTRGGLRQPALSLRARGGGADGVSVHPLQAAGKVKGVVRKGTRVRSWLCRTSVGLKCVACAPTLPLTKGVTSCCPLSSRKPQFPCLQHQETCHGRSLADSVYWPGPASFSLPPLPRDSGAADAARPRPRVRNSRRTPGAAGCRASAGFALDPLLPSALLLLAHPSTPLTAQPENREPPEGL